MTIRCVDVCDVTTAGSRPSSGTAASYRSPGFTIPRPRRTAFHSGHISLRGLRELCPRSRKSVSSALGAALTSSHTHVARWHRHLLGAGFSRREARGSGRAAKPATRLDAPARASGRAQHRDYRGTASRDGGDEGKMRPFVIGTAIDRNARLICSCICSAP